MEATVANGARLAAAQHAAIVQPEVEIIILLTTSGGVQVVANGGNAIVQVGLIETAKAIIIAKLQQPASPIMPPSALRGLRP